MRDLLSLLGHTLRDDDLRRWFVRDEGAERLARDRVLIKKDYPDLEYVLNFRQRRVYLDGVIKLRTECGIPTRVKTRVIFPDAYPESEPIAYETGGMFLHIPNRHFYSDGGCCLWLPVESQWKSRDPAALHLFLDHVATFFERQLIYDALPEKHWPWGERSHDLNGYIEYVQEKLGADSSLVSSFIGLLSGKENIDRQSACPCGSGKRFKHCHAARLAKVLTRLDGRNPFVSIG